MLQAGWGGCGQDVEIAVNTFKVATDDNFKDVEGIPKYYNLLKETEPAHLALNKEACIEFYQHLCQLA